MDEGNHVMSDYNDFDLASWSGSVKIAHDAWIIWNENTNLIEGIILC